MFKKKGCILTSCIVCALLFAVALPGHAASSVTVLPSGNGSFILQGNGMEKVAAIEIILTYNNATLRNPRVTQGALVTGALMAVNPNVPGTIRIAMVSTNPVSGNGPIAAIVFDRADSSQGQILSMNVKLADLNGQQLPAAVQVANPVDQPAGSSGATDTPTSAEEASSRTASPAPAPPPLPGVVIVRPETGAVPQQAPGVREAEETKETPRAAMEQREPGTTGGKAEPRPEPVSQSKVRKVHAHKSALDRFKEYKGAVSMKEFLSFFEQDALLGFRQEPAVVLADGTARARVTFISVPGERSSSEAALAGAKLVSLARDPDYSNTWIADIQPAKGEHSASLSIPQGSVIMLFPLSVAPALNVDLDKSGSVAEADFELFLKDRTAKAPRFDLNGDGKRDYLDDYLFTANYLVRTRQKPKT